MTLLKWIQQEETKPLEDFINKIICGDSLEVMRELPDECVDAIITDPPYGIGFKEIDIHKEANDYWNWFKHYYNEMYRLLKKGGFMAIWQHRDYIKHYHEWFGEDIRIYSSCRNFVPLAKTPINSAWTPIVLKYKEGANSLVPKKQKRSVDFYVANTIIIQNNKYWESISWHPSPKPLDQVIELVVNFTIEDAIILDPFFGSGTLGVAAIKRNRKFIGVEINPDFVERARNRISSHFKQKKLFSKLSTDSSSPKTLSIEERIEKLRAQNKSWREIGMELGLSHEYCRQLYKFREMGI